MARATDAMDSDVKSCGSWPRSWRQALETHPAQPDLRLGRQEEKLDRAERPELDQEPAQELVLAVLSDRE